MTARLSLRALFPAPLPLGEPGDPGVVVPGGVFQRLWGDRLLLAGGPAAILMQVAHPLVAAGIAQHSDYQERPGHRLLATLDLTLSIGFGDTAQARAAVAKVGRRHTTVNGVLTSAAGSLPAGTRYDATDPELALWVYATLVWTALRVHELFGTRVDAAEREDYWQQSKPFARLFGVGEGQLPPTWDEFAAYVEGTLSGLVVTEPARSVCVDMVEPHTWPPLPGLGPLLRAVTAGLLPSGLAEAYGLAVTPGRRRAIRVLPLVTRAVWRRLPVRLREFPHVRVSRRRVSMAAAPLQPVGGQPDVAP